MLKNFETIWYGTEILPMVEKFWALKIISFEILQKMKQFFLMRVKNFRLSEEIFTFFVPYRWFTDLEILQVLNILCFY